MIALGFLRNPLIFMDFPKISVDFTFLKISLDFHWFLKTFFDLHCLPNILVFEALWCCLIFFKVLWVLTHTILHFGFYVIEKIHYLPSLFLLFNSPFEISIYMTDSAMWDFDDSTNTFEMKAEFLITLILIHIIF